MKTSNKKVALTQFHRSHILAAAKELFATKGVAGTSMDDIARNAEYSKSTIYVYFSGKDDIYYSIVNEYMEMLLHGMENCYQNNEGFVPRYFAVCALLSEFLDREPLYAEGILGKIGVDEADFEKLPVLKKIYDAGEQINTVIARMFQDGVQSGFTDQTLPAVPAGLVYWFSLCSLISASANKEAYLKKSFGMERGDFLKFGFTLLLNAVRKKENP